MRRTSWLALSLLALFPIGIFGACESEETPAPGTATPTASTTGSGAGVGGTGVGGWNNGGSNTGVGGSGASSTGGQGTGGELPDPTEYALCQGHIYECGDLVDNDLDGLMDYKDPDCLGPCDDTEDSLYGGIPGSAGPGCDVDCYFDQDSGAGNDNCYWSHKCDPISIAPNFYPEPWLDDKCEYQGPDYVLQPIAKTCSVLLNTNGQSQECLDYCLPLTPNGCDCFGCCVIPGAPTPVWLGSEGMDGTTVCTLAEVDDPTLCHPCTQVTDCVNDCGHCEICIGKPTLPPDCFGTGGSGSGGSGAGGSPPARCDPGVQACGLPGDPLCPTNYYCLTGCCQKYPT